MKKEVLIKCLWMIPTILGVTLITFLLIKVTPGDPLYNISNPRVSSDTLESIRNSYGFNQSVLIQYKNWLIKALKGDFGISYLSGKPVWNEVSDRLPATLLLMGTSFVISILLSCLTGFARIFSSKHHLNKVFDLLLLILLCIPSFWLGIILMYFFSVDLGILPLNGMNTPGKSGWWDTIRHMLLPVMVLVIQKHVFYHRYIYGIESEEMQKDYIRLAISKGGSRYRKFSRHLFKNVSLPLLTQIGIDFSTLITGAFITETIFSWPGVGQLLINGLKQNDYFVVMAIVTLSCFCVIIGSFVVELLITKIDPRN